MHGPCCRWGRRRCCPYPLRAPTAWGHHRGALSPRAVQPSAAAGPLKGGGPESHFLNNFFCSRALRASSRASYSALVPKFFVRWRLRTECLHVVLRFAGRAPTSSPGCSRLPRFRALFFSRQLCGVNTSKKTCKRPSNRANFARAAGRAIRRSSRISFSVGGCGQNTFRWLKICRTSAD